MNKNLHRIVFNARRGLRMVVQETAKSTGKGSSKATTVAVGAFAGAAAFAPMLVGAALAGMLSASPAQAQIVGAPNVPGNLRPTVMVAPNGVPLVNIQTPSAAGVSRNIFNQFNVAPNGAILNNSRTNVATQLGGIVQGNPYLATGPARIIVNEVNGGSPSQLRGYIEVAGQRAEVIIANPAGISINGGGFINASRATVTTGTPQFNAIGGLDSFLVRGGTVTIDGAGLDASKTDYAAILARAVQLNAAIYATDLKVVTGANQVSADHTQITPTTGTGAAPTFALDVAALGGMYAGKITLIGTEAGLGVRNAGSIGASNGNLIVTAAGRLENTGTLEGTRLELASAGGIDNRSGTIRQTSSVGLAITAPVLSNTNGGVIGIEPAPAPATTGTSGGTSTGTGATSTGTTTTGATSGTSGTASPAPAPYVPTSPGTLTAGGAILNDGGKIYAGGPVTLNTPQINNAGGALSVASMAVTGPTFSNAGGTLNVSNSFSANVGQLDNAGGTLNAGSLNIATTGDLINVDGTLTSATDATLTVGGQADNTRGTISATGALTANVAGALNNTAGTLASNQGLTLTGQSLNNSQGTIQSAGGNVQATIGQQLLNTDGRIASGANLTIQTGSLEGTKGSLQSTGDLNVTAAQGLTSTGTNAAGGNLALQGASVDLSGSHTGAAHIAVTATQGDVTTSGATVATPGTLAITANAQPGQTLVNSAGQLNAGQLQISVSNLANTNGGEIVQTGTGATTIATSGTLNNDGGRIASNGQDLSLNGASITNTGGKIEHAGAGTLAIAGGNYSGSNGQITTNGALAVALSGAFNQDGGTTYAQQIDLSAGSLSNQGGSLVQAGTGATTLAVGGLLNNNAGTIASNGAIAASAGSVSNQGGTLQAGGASNLSLTATGPLDNSAGGKILAGGNTTLAAGSLNNNAGSVTAVGDLNATIGGAATNVGGTLAANGNTTLTAASLDNSAGTTAAVSGNLNVTTTGTTTNGGGTLQAGGATTLSNGGLSNQSGKVFGNSLVVDTHGNTLNNTQGTLAATTTVAVSSGALVNDAGLVQTGAAMTIHTNGQSLSNTNAAGYSNGQGGITSGGTLTLNTGAVNNTAGFIGANGALTADTQAFTNTSGGLVLSQSTVAIHTQGAGYDNSGGQTLAVGDVGINAGSIANVGGLIRSTATTTLNAGSIDNRLTSGAEQGIEGQNVAIVATTVDNTAGAIRADVNTTLTSSGRIDNGAGGLIHAGDTLAIVDPNAANPGAKTLSVANGGTLLAGKALVVDAASLANTSRLLSQQDMRLVLTQDAVFAAGSETIANRDLGIATTGNIRNSGRIAAGNALSLAAANIDNTATGDIQGTTTHLSATGTVTNRGVIDGVVTRIDAGTLTNIGTGRIYGDQISIGVGTLNNLAETAANGATSAATIAARQRLDIGATTVNNRDGSLIFSDGDLFIGGGLDAAGHATGSAGAVNNHAATIEATRNVDIKTATLSNTNGGVTWTLEPGSDQHIVEYALPGSSVRYAASEVLFSIGGFERIPDIGWNGWAGVPATDPQAPGSNANVRLLIPSPDYPLAQFRAYYLRSPANSADRSYQHCSGGDVQVCETVAMPGSWYARTDPIWATFGVTPPAEDLPADFIGRLHPDITVGQEGIMVSFDTPSGQPGTRLEPFDHPVTQAEYDQWQAYRTAHQALDEATLDFIHTMTGHRSLTSPSDYKPARMSSTYDAYDYTVTSSTPVLQSSAPAKILAGGAMNIAVGSGVNDMSQILAGGALTVAGGKIVDKGLTVDAPTVQKGIAIHSSINEHDFGSDERVYQLAPYNLTTNATVTLAAARQEGNVAFVGSGTGTGTLASGQTGAGAQGAGGVGTGTRVHPIVQVPSAVGGAGQASGASATAAQGPGGSGAASAPPMVVRTTTPNTAIPTASLFVTHPESSSRYLVETDPRFANHRTWLSSDYLLNNLGLDPNYTLKRLGDGFYEQRLVREQVAQLTGFRFLDGFESDDAQYTALMNAGATFAKQYGLRPGIALTDAQMAQLTSDIVWLVEQTVTLPDGSTQRVLVPQVYVHVKAGDIDGSGAVLSGRSVDMRFSGDLTNSGGTIAGRHAVALSADNIHNLAGRITGEDVSLTAKNDINVIGAVVDASKSLTAFAGRDINVVTTTRDSKSDTGALARSDASSGVNLSATTLDRVAGLYVTNPGGSLTLVAMRDANLVGAEVKSAGDATVVAGRDVNLGTVTTGRTEDIRWSSNNTRKDEASKETGTIISAAGDVSIGAGRNLTGVAATLSAGETLALSAGDQLTLVAGENATSATTKDAWKNGLSHSSLNADSQETTLARTTLTGKDIQLKSGGDMTLSAIEATAENIGVDAGGKLNLLTQKTTSAASRTENDGDGAWVSASSSGRADETSQYNLFNTPNLSVKANGGVTVQLGQNASLADLAKQPGMAWVDQLANDPALANSVEWQRVQEEHKKWAESQTSLGPVAALVVSVVVGMVAGPVAAQAGTAASGAAAGAGMGATVSAGVGAAVQAGVTALASRAAVSFVNNEGNIGKVLEELGSSESVKSLATAIVTAGVLQGLSEVLPQNLANATNGSAKFTDQLQRQLIDGAASAVIRSAINGTSLEDELRWGLTEAILNTVAAQSADGIGKLKYDGDINAFTQNVLHAIAGCAVGAARADSSSGCGAGALGAVIGELTANAFGRDEYGNVMPGAVEMTQVLAAIGGAVAGLDAQGIYIAANSSVNAAINNALSLRGSAKLKGDLRACSEGTGKSCDVDKLRDEMTRDTQKQAERIERDCGGGGSLSQCLATSNHASLSLTNLTEAYLYADTPEKKALITGLIDQQVTDMTAMYAALEQQHSAAGASELLKTAIMGSLPYASMAIGGMVGSKLGGTKGSMVQASGGQLNQNGISGANGAAQTNSLARIAQDGHALERHGGGVTDQQLLTRALTGVAPDGSSVVRNGQTVIPPSSTAFHSDSLLAQSDQFIRQNYLDRAIAISTPGAQRVTVEGVDMGVNIGRGFDRVSSAPGAVGPLQFNSNLSRATAVYSYDATAGVWRTVTIYPVK